MKVAYLFPGQGAQYVGMGKAFYDASPDARRSFETANAILGFDLTRLCFEGPAESLISTANSQSAILVASIVALRALEAWASAHGISLEPVATAGLSLGEYSALVAAGSLSFEDAVRLVRRRGELMEAASREQPGTMCSLIGLTRERVEAICRRTGAEVANLNCPGQVVISGRREAVAQAAEEAKRTAGAKAVMLDVSGAFHSSLMASAAKGLAQALAEVTIRPPRYAVVANVDAQPCVEPAQIRQNLIRQLTAPTLWEQSMRALVRQGITQYLEVGPGKVLRGLFRRIDATVMVAGVEAPGDLERLVQGVPS